MNYLNSFSKEQYKWNNAYNYIMLLKERYINQFSKLDTFDVRELAKRLVPFYPEYDNFLKCLDIHVQGSLNTFHYSLIKGGDIDLYTNKESIYLELRGTVIDLENNELVNCPFKKFFNINERYLVKTAEGLENEYHLVDGYSLDEVQQKLKNAKKIEITDKMDGSMHSARYYNNDIVYASSLTSNRNLSYRLAEGFTWLTENHKKMIKDNPHLTFIFEYISLKDVHTVTYKEEQQGLYLIGIRDVTNGKQWFYSDVKKIAEQYNVEMVKIEKTSLDTILVNREKFSGTEKEGWVLNIDGELYKLKTNGYIQLAKILTMLSSPKLLIHKIADDELDDFLTYLPKDAVKRIMPSINKIKEYRDKLLQDIDYYYSMAPKDSRGTFAKYVVKNTPSNIKYFLFTLYDNYELEKIKETNEVLWKQINDYYMKAPKDENFADYINENVPKELRKYLFLLYNGIDFNVLKIGEKYAKVEDIFGVNYESQFRNMGEIIE